MRLRLPLLLLIVAVAVLLTQWAPGPGGPGEAPSAGSLPPEAIETLRLIEQGGPFPHRQDGTVFQNRERLLPARARGYYREYTVRTPGAQDRGARRIVTGGDPPHVFYYTEDHYRSFREIEAPR
jgi:ribonuclease T1